MMVVRKPAMALRGSAGLGTDPVTPAPGFVDGVMAWKAPGTAVSAFTSTIQGGNLGDKAAYLGGLAVVPLGLLVVASQLMGGRRRRR